MTRYTDSSYLLLTLKPILVIGSIKYYEIKDVKPYQQPLEDMTMSKGQDSKKNVKKKPLLTAKEKKAAKQVKKGESSILGKH